MNRSFCIILIILIFCALANPPRLQAADMSDAQLKYVAQHANCRVGFDPKNAPLNGEDDFFFMYYLTSLDKETGMCRLVHLNTHFVIFVHWTQLIFSEQKIK